MEYVLFVGAHRHNSENQERQVCPQMYLCDQAD